MFEKRFQSQPLRSDHQLVSPFLFVICQETSDIGDKEQNLTMGLEESRLGKVQTRLPVRVDNQPRLGFFAGLRQTRRVAILVRPCGPDHRADDIAVADGVAQTLDHDDAESFTARVAVGALVEGEASSVGGEEVHVHQRDDTLDGENQAGAGNQSLSLSSSKISIRIRTQAGQMRSTDHIRVPAP